MSLSLCELVANCDHLSLFLFRKQEHKIFGESTAIAFNLLIQPLRGCSVKTRQIGVQHDPLSPN